MKDFLKQNLLKISGLLFLIIALGVGFSLVSKPQEIREKASSDNSLTKNIQYRRPIAAVKLLVDNNTRTLEIKSIKKGLGLLPDYRNTEILDFITVELILKNKEKKSIVVPISAQEVYVPPRNKGEKLNYPPRKQEKIETTVFIPYEEESSLNFTKKFQFQKRMETKNITFSFGKEEDNSTKIKSEGKEKEVAISDLSVLSYSKALNTEVKTVFDGNPAENNPQNTLDIVFISSSFSQNEMGSFDSFVARQAGSLIGFSGFPGKEPFSGNKKYLKVRSVFLEADFQNKPLSEAMEILSVLGVPFDQIAVVLNKDGRSYASLGGGYCYLYITWGSPERNLLFAHELAHSLAAVLDEYTEYYGQSDFLYWKNRNCKEDPQENWVEGVSGGSYLGCNYVWNIYRPEESSLMIYIGDDYEFNEPSKVLLRRALSSYTKNGLTVIYSPNEVNIYQDMEHPYSNFQQSILFYNLTSETVSFSGILEKEVPWISSIEMNGVLPPGPFSYQQYGVINLDFTKAILKGRYETTIKVDFISPSIRKTEIIKIFLYIGSSLDNIDVNLTSPKRQEIYEYGQNINLAVNTISSLPGIRKIEYYFIDPSSNSVNIASARTIVPYSDIFNSNKLYYHFGTFSFFAKAYPFFGPQVESPRIEIDIKVQKGALCSNFSYLNAACSFNKINNTCFLGTDDCKAQNMNYCCPYMSSLTPTPTSLPTSTPKPTPTPVVENIERVELDYSDIKLSTLDNSLKLTATAYDSNNQPIISGITYKWVIVSSTVIGHLQVNKNTALLTPLKPGTGIVKITARAATKEVYKEIPLTVLSQFIGTKKGWNSFDYIREGEKFSPNCQIYTQKTDWWEPKINNYNLSLYPNFGKVYYKCN